MFAYQQATSSPASSVGTPTWLVRPMTPLLPVSGNQLNSGVKVEPEHQPNSCLSNDQVQQMDIPICYSPFVSPPQNCRHSCVTIFEEDVADTGLGHWSVQVEQRTSNSPAHVSSGRAEGILRVDSNRSNTGHLDTISLPERAAQVLR